jgi:hypothetical protein
MKKISKSARGISSQFFVAAELCRRGYVASVTQGNTPITDILCSNAESTKFIHIQVKTYRPGDQKVLVGEKAEKNYGKNFIWILAGIPEPNQVSDFEYYVVPSSIMSKKVKEDTDNYMKSPAVKVKEKKSTSMRTVFLHQNKRKNDLDKDIWVSKYLNNWEIIDKLLR